MLSEALPVIEYLYHSCPCCGKAEGWELSIQYAAKLYRVGVQGGREAVESKGRVLAAELKSAPQEARAGILLRWAGRKNVYDDFDGKGWQQAKPVGGSR